MPKFMWKCRFCEGQFGSNRLAVKCETKCLREALARRNRDIEARSRVNTSADGD